MGTVVGVKQDPKASTLDAKMFRIARQSSEDSRFSLPFRGDEEPGTPAFLTKGMSFSAALEPSDLPSSRMEQGMTGLLHSGQSWETGRRDGGGEANCHQNIWPKLR